MKESEEVSNGYGEKGQIGGCLTGGLITLWRRLVTGHRVNRKAVRGGERGDGGSIGDRIGGRGREGKGD